MKRILPAGERYGLLFAQQGRNKFQKNFFKSYFKIQTLIGLLVILIVSPSKLTFGQKSLDTKNSLFPLIVGQTVPVEVWTRKFEMYDYDKIYSKTLESHKGKSIIIAFWSIYCGSCLSSFPLLNKLSETFPEDFEVIFVNSYDKDFKVINRVLGRFDESYKISSIIRDDYLLNLFPHVYVPHYIWLKPNGSIASITGKGLLNEENIKNFIESHEN